MKYDKIEKFKYVTSKILPSVYDESLSYSELLAKVISYLNTTITNVDEIKKFTITNVDEIKKFTNTNADELKKFIDDFVDDFVEKFDKKLDPLVYEFLKEMYDNGDLKIIIDAFMSNKTIEIDNTLEGFNSQLAQTPNYVDVILQGTKPIYGAHRGFSHIAPENTIASIEAAGRYGFKLCEVDLWETSDGEIAIIHDPTVDRTTNGTGSVAEMTLSQIRALTVDDGPNIEHHPNLKTPTLDEYLDKCIEYNMFPWLEIKHAPIAPKVLEVLKSKGLESKSILFMPDKTMMTTIRGLSSKVMLALLSDDVAGNIDFLKETGNIFITPHHSEITQEKVNLAHENGIPVACWGPYKYEDLINMHNLKVDIIMTDGVMLGGNL